MIAQTLRDRFGKPESEDLVEVFLVPTRPDPGRDSENNDRPGTRVASSVTMPTATRLEQIMTSPVHAIAPTADVADAKQRMEELHVRHLVVVRDDDVVGLLSERDLARARPLPFDDRWRVVDVMSREVVTATPATTVGEGARLVRESEIGCLPILEGKKLVGIVTTSDLLDLLIPH